MRNHSIALTDSKGEVREITRADMPRFRPAGEVLPEIFSPALATQMLKPKGRGPGKKPVKVVTTLRLRADTLARWKATGRGWQTRMAEVLDKAL